MSTLPIVRKTAISTIEHITVLENTIPYLCAPFFCNLLASPVVIEISYIALFNKAS